MAVITRDARRRGLRARLRAISWSLAIIPLTIVCVGLAIVFAAEELYAQRVLPGVTVAGVDIGSLTRDAALDRLEGTLAQQSAGSTVIATFNGRQWSSTTAALGVHPDAAAAADAALALGKTGSLSDHLAAWGDALRGEARVPLTLQASGDALERWLATISAQIDRPAVAGEIAVDARGLTVTEPVVGLKLDKVATAATILAAQSIADRRIDLAVRQIYPAVDEAGFAEATARAKAATTPLSVVVEDRRVNEDAAGLASLLVVDRTVAKPGELPAVPAGAIAPATRYRYTVSLDQTRLADWVKALGAKLDRPAVNARYAVNKDGALGIVSGVTGIRLDQDKMRALMQSELFTLAGSVRELAAPSGADSTAFTTDQAKEWQSKLVKTSSFTTSFPVSASRHANIATGASQFDGVVIMPGQTFSFPARSGHAGARLRVRRRDHQQPLR